MKDKITKRSSIRFSIIERINYYFSDPLKKHNNSIESVKETEKQSKETAPLFDFLSSHKGDNSPPQKITPLTGVIFLSRRRDENLKGSQIYALRKSDEVNYT